MSVSNSITAALLVGGMGTRLRSVLPSTPKPLASLGDKSFLELLVCQLQYQGIRRLVMCTGYLADYIEGEFGDGNKWGVEIKYSKEPHALGTGGALKFARPHLQKATQFLVLNGDSFLEMDFEDLILFHRGHGGLASMAVRRMDDASRYGTVEVAARGQVTGFREKAGTQAPGLVNGGVYIFDPTIFDYIPDGQVSLERDIFPGFAGKGLYAQEQRGMFIDIGIPEDYARAQALREQLFQAAYKTPRRKIQELGAQ